MKKILMVLLAVMMVLPLSAQLKTKAKTSYKTIGTVRMGVIMVGQGSSGITLALKTSNQFDSPGIFLLGEDKESALQTISDMVELMETSSEDESVTVECWPGHQCRLVARSAMGIQSLFFYFDGCAGTQNITEKEFEKIRSIIEEKAQ